MDDREYFTVQETSLTIPRSGAMAIFAGDKPRKNDDGTTSFSLRGPLLLMPQEMWNDADDTMRNVAKVLNENAHLFFDSAPNPADLAQAPAPVRVKALQWDDFSHEAFTAQSPFGDYVVELHDGDGWGMWTPDEGETAPDAHCWHQTEESAKAAAQADYEARVLASLEPDAGVVAELVEALREISALDDNAECCGQGVCGGYSPPECCNQPLYGLDRAQNIARAALAKWGGAVMGEDTTVTALTREQAAILGAFTGILCGPFSDLHRYAEVKLGRPVWTHEFGSEAVSEQLREESREDFMSIVARDAK